MLSIEKRHQLDTLGWVFLNKKKTNERIESHRCCCRLYSWLGFSIHSLFYSLGVAVRFSAALCLARRVVFFIGPVRNVFLCTANISVRFFSYSTVFSLKHYIFAIYSFGSFLFCLFIQAPQFIRFELWSLSCRYSTVFYSHSISDVRKNETISKANASVRFRWISFLFFDGRKTRAKQSLYATFNVLMQWVVW